MIMYFLERDCILFKTEKDINLYNCQINTPYEKIDLEETNDSYKKIIYSWLDPIRIREKIFTNNFQKITLFYYPNKKVLVCFGSSESLIGYVINRFEKLYDLNLSKIELFNNYTEIVKAQLLNVHIQTNNSVNYIDDEEINSIVKLNIQEIPNQILIDFFNKKVITLLTFKSKYKDENVIYFYIDKGSVLTFPDTMKEDVIYYVLEKCM